MPSTFFGINIAASGMSTYNAGLNTTAHNISNAKTKGYSKQTVEQQAKVPLSFKTSYGMMGTGVMATDITSSRDVYYDYKYRKSCTSYGRYDTLSHYLENISTNLYAIDEKSGGISNSLDSFFKSLTELTEDVSNKTIRSNVIGYADNTFSSIREVANSLQQSQKELNSEIDSTVDKINSYAKQIASLNKQINTLEVYGSPANDLRDQRAVVIDQLSELVDVDVVEQAPADGQGLNQYLVFIGDSVLVDCYEFNQIQIETRTTKDNQNDIDGLYDLKWSNGQVFDIRNKALGGTLQGLLEMRDGNNGENFKATLDSYTQSDARYNGKATITVVSDAASSANASDLSKLNIPESNGILDIANYEYEYDSFEVSVGADGKYTYTFVLKDELTQGKAEHLQSAMDQDHKTCAVGDNVASRGIPYYMAQLNEFVRTFSANFNQVQNKGYDLNGNTGADVFATKATGNGEEFSMTEFLYNKKDNYYYLNGSKVVTSDKKTKLDAEGYTFDAVQGEANYYMMKSADGKTSEKVYMPAEDTNIFTFTSYTTKGQPTSYYNMTALSAVVSEDVQGDASLLATSTDASSGVSNGANLTYMTALREDSTMFKQGAPGSFLAVITATVGVDGEKINDCADNAGDLKDAVETRRMSKTGVDEDEEGQNMIIYQNLLNYQYRVISVMNEVLDKLINGTGV
mgnify:CR=1 FL=1